MSDQTRITSSPKGRRASIAEGPVEKKTSQSGVEGARHNHPPGCKLQSHIRQRLDPGVNEAHRDKKAFPQR